MTVIQRASSDLRLNPQFHTLFLDGVYLLGPEGEAPGFQATSRPTREDIEGAVQRAKRRILRYLEKRGVITFAAAPGDGEVEAVRDESLGEAAPGLARLFSAAIKG